MARLLSGRVWLAVIALALACVATGCLVAGYSAAPVAWDAGVKGGLVVREADPGETMKTGDDRDMPAVYAHIDVYREIGPGADNPISRSVAGILGGKEDMVVIAYPVAITEVTKCTVDDDSVEPEAFVQALLEAQVNRTPCNVLLTTADAFQNASTEEALVAVSLKRRQ